MATLVLDDCQIFLNDVDLTSLTNQAMFKGDGSPKEVSTFGSAGWREFIQTVRSTEFELGGPWGFVDPDDETWNHINTAQSAPALTISSTSTAGDVAYMTAPVAVSRDTGGAFGDVPTWKLDGKCSGPVYRGGVSLAKQTITGATNGTAILMANFSGDTDDVLAAFVHVFADNATSMDVIIERDDNPSFTTPTTVATIAVTAVGQSITTAVASALGNDTYYRARTANLVGTNFQIAVAIGTTLV